MTSRILIPACTGLTALALSACGSKNNAQPGSPPKTSLETSQKSGHFDAVSAHLDLGGIAYGYLDVDGDAEKLADAVQSLLDLAKEAGGGDVPPQIANLNIGAVLDDLGLTGIEAMGMSSYQNGDLYRNKYYLHVPAGRTGLLKVFGGEAGPFAAQKLAPAGSDLVIEQELDLKSAFALVRDLVGKVGGPEAAAEFARATAEPMRGGPPLTIAEVFANLDTRISIIARVHPDNPMPLPAEVPLKLPGIDALVALDDLGPLVTKLLASIPEDERAGMFEEGEGYQQMAIPLPPEIAQAVQPVVRHDIASGRVMIATSPEFLEECLSAKSSVWDDAGFKAAMEGLPEEGNALSFVSSEFMKEYLRVYGDAMDTLSQDGGAPKGLNETVIGLLQTMGMSPDHGQAAVTTNLPEGILMVQNSAASAKQAVVMSGAVVAGMGTAAFIMPMRASSMSSSEVEVLQEATRVQDTELRTFEAEPSDETPAPVPVPIPVPE